MFRRPLLLIFSAFFLACLVARALGVRLYSETPLDAAYSGEKTAAVAVGTIDKVTVTEDYEKMQVTDCEVCLDGGTAFLETNGLLVYGEGFSGFAEGGRVKLTGEICAFDTPDNPGEFNKREYYRTRGLDYAFYSDEAEIVEEGSFFKKFLGDIKKSLSDSVDRVCTDEDEAGIFKAFFLGDRSEMDEEQYGLIRAGGAAHILAISGLHLSLIGSLLVTLFKKLRLPAAPAAVAADVILLLYVIMLDGSASAWRAYIMFSVAAAATLTGRSYDYLSAVGLAGTLLLLHRPLYAADSAFLLSFAAALAIGTVYPVLRGACEGVLKRMPSLLGKTITALLFSLSVQLVTLPVTARFHYSFSLYGPLVNLIVLPFLSLALISVMTGALAGVFSAAAGGFFAGFAHYFFAALLKLCGWVESLPHAVIITGKPQEWQISLYYVLLTGLLVLLSRKNTGNNQVNPQECSKRKSLPALLTLKGKCDATEKKNGFIRRTLPLQLSRNERGGLTVKKQGAFGWTKLIVLLLLPTIPLSLTHIVGEPSITALYVGQGDCSVITTEENHAILIDCGSSSKNDVSKSVILPFLKFSGIDKVDAVFLSHADGDHINGLSKLLSDSSIHVGMVCVSYSSETSNEWSEVAELAQKAGVPLTNLKFGDTAEIGEVTFEVISPDSSLFLPEADKNERSMVLRMEYDEFSALFAGDIGELAESRLSEDKSKTDCDYLKCPHHGSKYSSSEDFLQTVSPALTVISAGRNNRYGHPAPETIERLRISGSEVFRTDVSGAVTTRLPRIAADGITVSVFNPRSP